MSDQNYQNPNDGWNEVPNQAPIPPQQPIPPAQPIPPQPYASDFVEPVRTFPDYVAPVQDDQEAVPPTPPTVPVYDPVLEEQDPYVSVDPTAPAYTSAPSYSAPAPAYQPPAEKKKNGWVIALITILVLCLCVLIIGGIVIWAMVSSGKYRFEFSYLLLDALSLFF